jgi:hypothetical protein
MLKKRGLSENSRKKQYEPKFAIGHAWRLTAECEAGALLALVAAVEAILRTFCDGDDHLLAQLWNKSEVLNADAASEEQLSLRFLPHKLFKGYCKKMENTPVYAQRIISFRVGNTDSIFFSATW